MNPNFIASPHEMSLATGGTTGFTLVLDSSVADVVEANLAADVESLLARHGLTVDQVRHWVAHPGGPKVLEAMQRALRLEADALRVTWRSLARVGNLSSSSVLQVLAETMDEAPAGAGVPAVMTAMGPGFCSEIVLLRW